MFNDKGFPHLANWSYSGRTSKLPPRSPLPSMTQTSIDSGSSPPLGKKHMPVSKGEHKPHQRTSSESFIIEEQPSWLDDLLNEPESPARRNNHRRSSSDSVVPGAFLKIDNISQHNFCIGGRKSPPLPVSRDIDLQKESLHPSFPLEHNSVRRSAVRGWEYPINSSSFHSCATSVADGSMLANSGSSRIQHGKEWLVTEKQELDKSSEYDQREYSERRENLFVKLAASDAEQHDQKGSLDKKEASHGKSSAPDTDPKRAKQHFAQRSRVRKLQYIAELERNAEGTDVAAELTFLKQQHLILSLENKALMQRISSIAHEKQIKDAQYELLRKEVERLRHMYSNQQQGRLKSQQPCGSAIADADDCLDLQFGCLSLNLAKHGDPVSVKEPRGMNKAAPYPCMMLQNY